MDEPIENPEGESAPAPEGPTKSELKKAMRAFKKRLNLMRLDDESGLGGGAMTGGRESSIVAIPAPSEFSQEVWDKLVEQGRLRDAGSGTYEILGG